MFPQFSLYASSKFFEFCQPSLLVLPVLHFNRISTFLGAFRELCSMHVSRQEKDFKAPVSGKQDKPTRTQEAESRTDWRGRLRGGPAHRQHPGAAPRPPTAATESWAVSVGEAVQRLKPSCGWWERKRMRLLWDGKYLKSYQMTQNSVPQYIRQRTESRLRNRHLHTSVHCSAL